MTRRKWNKKILAGFLGVLMLAGLAGCQEALSDEFQEDQVIAEAKEMVERINAGWHRPGGTSGKYRLLFKG